MHVKKNLFAPNPAERMSKKLDEVFGVIRSESVDDIKTEIKVRGMGDINLKRGKIRKTTVEHNKMDEYEQKRVARQQISMPEKPATFKKPKLKSKEEKPKEMRQLDRNDHAGRAYRASSTSKGMSER